MQRRGCRHGARANAPALCEVVRLTWSPRLLLSLPMKRHPVGVLVVSLAIGAFGVSSGCSENPVGRICDLGTSQPPGPGDVVVASPSLDCVTRTCIHVKKDRDLPPGSQYPSGNNGL